MYDEVRAGRPSDAYAFKNFRNRQLHLSHENAYRKLVKEAEIDPTEFAVDEASVIVRDQNGRPYRLPKGDGALGSPTGFGIPRSRREVVTERDLFNAHGIFYYLPRPNSGGIAHIKPITTHNKGITDFCSWRGLLVLAGCRNTAGEEDGHFIKGEDGKVGLWFGDVDDLWKLGKPTGQGGPWKNTRVFKNIPSDPYLMTGFDKKTVELAHSYDGPVQFTIEVNFAMNIDMAGDDYGRWHKLRIETVEGREKKVYSFPEGFNAHWVRLKTDRDCNATARFIYD